MAEAPLDKIESIATTSSVTSGRTSPYQPISLASKRNVVFHDPPGMFPMALVVQRQQHTLLVSQLARLDQRSAEPQELVTDNHRHVRRMWHVDGRISNHAKTVKIRPRTTCFSVGDFAQGGESAYKTVLTHESTLNGASRCRQTKADHASSQPLHSPRDAGPERVRYRVRMICLSTKSRI